MLQQYRLDLIRAGKLSGIADPLKSAFHKLCEAAILTDGGNLGGNRECSC